MATRTPRKKESWWQTFPGVLTATAGVITALAGLVVALRNPRAGEPPPAIEQTAAGAGGSVAGGQIPPRSVPVSSDTRSPEAMAGAPASASAGRTISLPADAEVSFPGVKVVMKVISARLEPFNAEKRSLRLKVRVSNQGSGFARTYYWTFRLLVDGVPHAPSVDPRGEQVEAQSAKEVEYVFEVPATVRNVVFRISRDEETRDIPLDLTI